MDPQIVLDRMQQLEDLYTELVELSQERRDRLEESRKLWQFFADIAEEEAWIKEKEQMLSSADIGRDLTSINLLLTKQKVILKPCRKEMDLQSILVSQFHFSNF